MPNRTIILLSVIALALSCNLPQPKRKPVKAKPKVRQVETELPVLMFRDTTDRRFVLSNGNSGLFYGHSKKENAKPGEGWRVDGISVLSGYRVTINGKEADRKKIKYFRYLPFGFERRYQNGMLEKFLMADSINALVVQVEDREDVSLSILTPTGAARIGKQNPRFASGGGFPLKILFQQVSDDVSRFWFIADHSLNKEELTDATYRKLMKRAMAGAKRKKMQIGNKTIDRAALWVGLDLDAFGGQLAEPGRTKENSGNGDVLRSFSGALLLGGTFEQAQALLRKYAALQLTDKSYREYGRLPDKRIYNKAVFTSSDITWRFIRALYEYYLFSADSALVAELFPTVRRAVQGALQFRCDENKMLIHGDAETWMDGQGTDGAWVPRGNRAVEIQALWYTALQIAAKMARVSGADTKISDSWLRISRRLKEKFNMLFWDKNRNALYDHLKESGQPDSSLRPNQIFAVSAPDLYGIEPLLSRRRQYSVAKTVTEELTLPAGVLTLSARDRRFHPFYRYIPYYPPRAARFNGMIWSGMAGPVISSLVKFEQQNTAEELLLNEARQILDSDPPGRLAEIREPVLRPGKTKEVTGGQPESMWGAAEFRRNLVQDILGYHPAAGDSLVLFKPRISKKIQTLQTRVPYKKGWIAVTLTAENGTMDVTLRSEVGEKINGRLECPGDRPAVTFMLQDSGSSFQYSYVPGAKPEILPSKILREWMLAAISDDQGFPVLAAPQYVLFKAQQIFLPPGESGYTVLFKRDRLEDDHGAQGTYIYPKGEEIPPGGLDLESFTLYDMRDYWGFRVTLRAMSTSDNAVFLAFAVRDETIKGALKRNVERGARFLLPKERAFNRILYVGAGIDIQDGSGKLLARFIPAGKVAPLAFAKQRQVRFKIPKKYMPGLNTKSRLTILCGVRERVNGKDNFRSATEKDGKQLKKNRTAAYDILKMN